MVHQLDAGNNHRNGPCFALGASINEEDDSDTLLVLFPLPFYFLELLVGLLQAFVFAMLCAVYVKQSTDVHE